MRLFRYNEFNALLVEPEQPPREVWVNNSREGVLAHIGGGTISKYDVPGGRRAGNDLSHTSNKWEVDEHGYTTISNMVYKFQYIIKEEKDYKTEKVYAFDVTWDFRTQYVPIGSYPRYGEHIAGQRGKRFESREAAEKYLNGRFKAYMNHFTEISPPIPPDYARFFKVSDMLLPGYTVQGEEPMRALAPAPTPENIIVDDAPAWKRKPKKEKPPAPKGRTGPAI